MTYFNILGTPDYAIETRSLSKVYYKHDSQPVEALKAVDLQIPRGSFFALLGPNGAGKSTLINILAGLVNNTSGSAAIWGHDAKTQMRVARRSIGVVPQELNIDPFFTPREMLETQAGLYGIPQHARRTSEILQAVGLSDKADSYARALSGGMRRRLLVGKAMVHSPPILVLDEPSAGVDVDLRRQLWDHVKQLNAEGTTILLTTHYLEEAESMCDTIAIINSGRMIACEPTMQLLTRLDAKEMLITVDQELDACPETLAIYRGELLKPRQLRVAYPPSRVTGGEIFAALAAINLGVVDIVTREPDLEHIFLNLTHASGAGGEYEVTG
ncbi:MAG: multidrug ABC transporter ATP-binding protein [Rhodospirillaceae bacterium TMED8]|nr:multidrug ABC transporter ATP-binding protein [Magnetovibrio sp.]OUT47762.1 MAG: multidrug ABC transporter ATP-binding protein [Rhodospirillaceae bacterium TMED8]|tara:strand:+ start:4727 stop:5710 length:984 start_codon:yes stop_codon:yes gene_type:complete